MNTNHYKWRLRFTHPHKGEGLTLVPLPCIDELPIVHRPGDIDYTDLKLLSYEVKTDVLHYLNQGHVPDDSRREAAAIAACIMVDRLFDSTFIPKELPPTLCNW